MKNLKQLLFVVILSMSFLATAQEANTSEDSMEDTRSTKSEEEQKNMSKDPMENTRSTKREEEENVKCYMKHEIISQAEIKLFTICFFHKCYCLLYNESHLTQTLLQ